MTQKEFDGAVKSEHYLDQQMTEDRFKELAGELARCCIDVAVALERALEVLEAESRTHHDQTKAQ